MGNNTRSRVVIRKNKIIYSDPSIFELIILSLARVPLHYYYHFPPQFIQAMSYTMSFFIHSELLNFNYAFVYDSSCIGQSLCRIGLMVTISKKVILT